MQITSGIPFFGLARQYNNIREETLEAIDGVLKTGLLVDGPYTKDLEDYIAENTGSNYAVTVGSGTQALEMFANYIATNMLPTRDTTVLIPSMTYIATAHAFVKAGFKIEFVDVDQYGIISPEYISRLDRKFYVIVPVGLYGASLTDVLRDKKWAFLHSCVFVADAAQNWLCPSEPSIDIGGAISFDPTKNLGNNGNAGAIYTNSLSVKIYAQEWRANKPISVHNGLSKGHCATNSRISESDAAVLLVKASYINDWQERRKSIASYWIKRFENTKIKTLIDASNFKKHSFHKFVINADIHRDSLQLFLTEKGIETRIHYSEPLHELYPTIKGPGMLSTASTLSRRILSLPFYPELTDAEVEYIADAVVEFAANKM